LFLVVRLTNSFIMEVKVARIALAARRFIKDEEGAALAEYGILVAFIAIVAITAVTFFGSRISTKFSQIANSFS
jgi:pilus assembly protein Flp/PilA